ncbi:MAG: MFS transporter [Rhodomicrobiaceae bacterium]
MKNLFRDYARLMSQYPAPLAFGFLHTFLSSPGQTFFIALFVGSLSAHLGLSAGEMGGIYLLGTLASAGFLTFLGHWIDRIDLRLFAGASTVGLGLACLLMASANTVPLAIAAIVLLRLTGQGLMTHIEATATARYFGRDRGTALSLTGMGISLGEGVLPLMAVALIGVIGWQSTYAAVGFAILLAGLPLSQALLVRRSEFSKPASHGAGPRPTLRNGAATVARSRFFWLALLLFLYMPFTSTALLFHIETVANHKVWPLELVASAFTLYAVMNAVGLLVSGRLVDHFTALRITPLLLVPFLLSLCLTASTSHWSALFLLLAATGLTAGFLKTVLTALWVELFGVTNVGAIRALATTLMVAGTAGGPAVLGYAMDWGVSINTILWTLAVVGGIASLLAGIAVRLELTPPAGRAACNS